MNFWSDPALWAWACAAGAIVVGLTLMTILRWKSYDRSEPIDWEPYTYTSELPLHREIGPREMTYDELHTDLLQALTDRAQARLENLMLESRVHALETQLAKQTMLKRRYWRALKKAGLR